MTTISRDSHGLATDVKGMRQLTAKSDTDALPGNPRGFVVGGSGGTLNLSFVDGSVANNVPCLAGVWYRARITHVRTGGTVTDVWILY